MPFWSGQTLTKNLKAKKIVDPFDPDHIDCAAYELSMGPEYYITPGKIAISPTFGIKRTLKEGGSFKIPPGQFALLLTEEKLAIPDNVLAFISMKSRPTKWKGLVNVSGFHVDPGFKGRLIFSAYNAGPSEIHITRGDRLFLIWFANLDEESETKYKKSYNKKNPPQIGISSSFASDLSGQIFSPMTLETQVRKIVHSQSTMLWLMGIFAPILLGAAGWMMLQLMDLTDSNHDVKYQLDYLQTRFEVKETSRLPVTVQPALIGSVAKDKKTREKQPK